MPTAPIESEPNLEHPPSFTNVTKPVGVPPPPHPKPPVFQPPSGPSLQSEPVLHDHVKPAVPPPPIKKPVDFPKRTSFINYKTNIYNKLLFPHLTHNPRYPKFLQPKQYPLDLNLLQ